MGIPVSKYLLLSVFLLAARSVSAQRLEDIYFHLYTDSLKKGTYNYINVDGKYSNGRWKPLTDKELSFSADTGYFKGNSLWIPEQLTASKVRVKVWLKTDTTISKSIDIYIKVSEDWGKVVRPEEIEPPRRTGRRQIELMIHQ